MSDNPDKLSRETIMAALRRLDELLREKGVIGELCIFGGAAMVLAFDARESTRDVDAIFVPKEESLLPPRIRFFIEETIGELGQN